MKMRLFQYQVIALFINLLGLMTCGCCQLHGALVGLSTNVPCDGMRSSNLKRTPPFWIINGTVYELFSIPRHFPFIPMITRFASLYIPLVSPALNNTTFQCARLGTNAVENGTMYQLQVVQGSNEEESILFEDIPELVLNYQELYIQDNRVTISWVLNDTCSERFQVQGYTLDTGEPVLSPEHVFEVGNSASVVLALDSNISYKLVALGENVSLCNSSNRDIYYSFSEVSTSTPFSSSCFCIPPNILCLEGNLNFIWPSRAEGRSCVCPVHNSSAGRRVFESCVEGCRDTILTPTLTEEGHICITNSSSLIGKLFHFVCSSDLCDGEMPCFSQNLLSSHVTAVGGTTSVTAPTQIPSGSSLENIPAIVASILTIVLLLATVFSLVCYFYQKKQRRTITLTKRLSFNTNYVSVSPQLTHVSTPQNNHNLTEQVDLDCPLYETIPGEINSSEQSHAALTRLSAEQQDLEITESVNLSQPQPQEGIYDIIAEDSGGKSDSDSCEIVEAYSSLNYKPLANCISIPPVEKKMPHNEPQDISCWEKSNCRDNEESQTGQTTTYSALGCPPKLQNETEHTYSVVNKEAKKKYRESSDEENMTRDTMNNNALTDTVSHS